MPKSFQLRMVQTALAVFIVLAGSTAQLRATQSSAKPTGAINAKQILEKNLAAMGGLENLHALQAMQLSGSITTHRVQPGGDFVFLYKVPASDSFEMNTIGLGQMVSGQKDGVFFFRRTARAVVRLNNVSAGVMAQAWRNLLESDLTSYREIKLVGLAQVNKRWAYALRFEPKAGDPTVHFYDSESFLMTRIEIVEKFKTEKDGPMKAYIIDTDFENYVPAANVPIPRLLTASSTDNDLEFHVQDVKVNIPIDDSKFSGN